MVKNKIKKAKFRISAKTGLLSAADQTKIFQQVLNKCKSQKESQVEIQAGNYTIGSLRISNNTCLHFDRGSVIASTKDLALFTDFGEKTNLQYVRQNYFKSKWHLPAAYFRALLCAYDAENIKIEAEPGVIFDGQNLKDPQGEEGFRGPMLMVFSRVKHLELSGYTVVNSANWAHAIESCQDVYLKKITVLAGHDGFGLHHSREIRLEDCILKTGDDCLAGYDIHDLKVNKCWFNTACNYLRIGGEKVKFTDCSFIGPASYEHHLDHRRQTLDFFSYYAIDDGDRICPGQDISFKNILIDGCRGLINYNINEQDHMMAGALLRNLAFEQVEITNLRSCSLIKAARAGLKISFKNSLVNMAAGQTFIKMNENVRLELKQVFFPNEITIVKGTNSLKLKGLINKSI